MEGDYAFPFQINEKMAAMSVNPYKIVEMFEEAIAEYCGSKYAVAVESCTAALFLSLQYIKNNCAFFLPPHPNGWNGYVSIPKHTYPGVPCSILHAGYKIRFEDVKWNGEYELSPLDIWDAALRFNKGMYHGGLQCLSFHVKKLLPIGRGGMILCDEKHSYDWLKKARFDGRNPVPLQEDTFTMLGWNMYMQPSDASRGLQLLQALGDRKLNDLSVESQKYPDLSKFEIYTK